ncbi:MAG: hypothetical protein ACR2MN_13405 [Acidimicrobiales bacterium]
MGKRNRAKALARWENDTQTWSTETARRLAVDLYQGRPTAQAPYRIGVVLDHGEVIWAETPMRFDADPPARPMFANSRQTQPLAPPIRPWLITNARVVGRLGDEQLHGWRWEKITGCRVGLDPGREFVALDLDRQEPLVWRGPAVAPLAIAAVFHLHGPAALVDHPGLGPLKVQSNRTVGDDHSIDDRLELSAPAPPWSV